MGKYGVSIPATDGSLTTGNTVPYIWSSNLGWIDFEPTGPYPTVDTGDDYAFGVHRSGNKLVGWARIVDIKTEYEKTPSNSGGWQGWIRTSSDSNDPIQYGIQINLDGTITKGQATSYVWSNELGWIDFSGALTASAALPPPTCSPGETYTYNCFNGDACVCGPVATTNLWKCMKKEVVCGAISLALQGDCTSNGVTSCSDTSCPACAASNGGWKEVSPN